MGLSSLNMISKFRKFNLIILIKTIKYCISNCRYEDKMDGTLLPD